MINGGEGTGTLVTGPACRPAPFGLLSVADVEDRADLEGHWLNGVSVDINSCDALQIHSACATNPMPSKADDATSFVTADSDPFFVVAGFKCSTGGVSGEEAREILRNRLNIGEARALETAFWTGKDAADNDIRQSLGTNPDVVDLTPGGGALSITDGIVVLESFAGDNYPCSPIIHGNRGMATYMAERNIVERDGNRLLMRATGTSVAVGGGYGATGPAGDVPDAGEGWLYITGGVKILRGTTSYIPGSPNDPSVIDRLKNDQAAFAERPYAIALDCLIGAVRVVTQSAYCPCA